MVYCPHCGEETDPRHAFCGRCGAEMPAPGSDSKPPAAGAGVAEPNPLTGWSSRIDLPVFKRHVAEARGWRRFVAVLVSILAALVGFFFIESPGGNRGNGLSRLLCLALAPAIGVFASFLLKRRGVSWDGVVIGKKIIRRMQYTYDGRQMFQSFPVKARDSATGRVRTISRDAESYAYYRVGDMVRYHPRLDYYEKYDKSRDDAVLCVFCRKSTPLGEDACQYCHKPLLK